ncbi:MFS transporter [Poseidonocella sp. HB161398]|uniref:MFS transporter n=1 Tax=Poseidonocella sp. HB161398 TaxID=2320855 RepID=UPI00110906BE|nr:MFS transporter [Poseidonocella sp. HB161398]
MTDQPADTAPRPGRQEMAVFLFLMLTQLIATLDNQIVATALPTIVGELGEAEHFSWLVSAYVLAQCVVMPVYGKLGDLFGRKRIMQAALLIFSAGALLCAMSTSMTALIVARTLQGLGNGGLLVLVLAISADIFEPRTRARFQGYLSFVFVFGSVVGPALGGLMTEWLGWRSIFLVTLPVALAAILGFRRFLPVRGNRPTPSIDYAGALTLAAAVTAIVIWVDSGRLFGSFSAPQSLFLAALVLLLLPALFSIERNAPEPVLPVALLRQRSFALLALLALGNGGISIGLITYHAYFLQMGVGLSPATAGLFFIALTIGVSAGALTTGRLLSRGGHFTLPLRISLAVFVLALGSLAAAPGRLPVTVLPAIFVLLGTGMGLAMNALVLGAQLLSPPETVGAATGSITLMRTVGAAIGIAVYGTIIAHAVEGLPAASGLSGTALTPGMMGELEPGLRAEVMATYGAGFSVLYMAAAGIAAASLVLTFFIRRN